MTEILNFGDLLTLRVSGVTFFKQGNVNSSTEVNDVLSVRECLDQSPLSE